jgi:lambda family phage tail tape measure protein
MVSTATIRKTIDIRGTSSGLDETKQKLVALGAAQDNVGVSSDKMAKSQLSLEQAMANLARISEQNARQYQQMVQMQRTATDAQMRSLNDNNKSISENGLEWAEWTNHVRSAGEAAYALSPKFRSLVNSMAGPAIGAATTAIETAATGIVRGTNLAGTGLIKLGGAVAAVNPALVPFSASIKSAGTAMEAFSPSIAGVATTILGKLMPALRLLGTAMLVFDAIKMTGEAWELGGKKLDEYRQIAEKAAAVDLSSTFFQKLTKGAKDTKASVDDLTKALMNLQTSSADELGGSALQQRLAASVKAGNFKGNTGVAEFAAANTTEEKYKAITSLIHQAMQDGQRLAALDISKTAFGAEATARLRQDSEYFDKINEAAAKVSDKDIVSDADVSKALDLQRRYEAAVAILEQRWHPIQDLLTIAGIKMQEAWVSIVESAAQAVDYITQLVSKIVTTDWKDVSGFFNAVQRGANAAGTAIVNATTTPESRKEAEKYYGITSDPAEMAKGTDAYADAVARLRVGLQNQYGVQQKVNEANAVANKARADTSHVIDDNAKKQQDANDAVDRAINSVTRHVEQQKADAAAVGLGAAALAEFRVEAAETAAVQANGGKETAEQAAQFAKLKVEAGAAADALARAKIDNTISRGRQTALLAPEDVTIANQLKDIYPDVSTALDSVEASGLRANSALSGFASTASSAMVTGLADATDGTKSFSQAASDMSKTVIRALEEMLIKFYIVMPIFRSLQTMLGGLGGIFGFSGGGLVNPGSSANPLPGLDASDYGAGYASGGYTGPGGKYQPAGIVHAGEYVFDQAATSSLGVSFLESLRRGATRGYDVGGLVTPSGPNIVPFYRPANDDRSGKTEVHIHGAPNPSNVQVQETVDGRGNRRIDVQLDDAVSAALSRAGSRTQRTLANSYGAKPVGVRR